MTDTNDGKPQMSAEQIADITAALFSAGAKEVRVERMETEEAEDN